MPGARRSRPSNSFPCVIADQCPDDAHCNKSFPTIEKHNEHLKRCHSSDFWCLKCLHKFNCSLPAGPLGLAKKEHDKTQCPGKPSQENRQLWESTWIMTPEQYHRFKDRGWKKTHVSNEVLLGREKDSVPQTSWRKIRETIFPGSDDAAIRRRRSERHTEDIRVMVAQLDNRPSILSQLRTDFQAPSADAMQPQLPNAFPPSVPTDDSQLSIIFSEGTDFGTHLSSRVWSHSGGDEQDQAFGFDLAGPPASMPYFSNLHEDCHGNQTLGSMTSGGVVQDAMPPLPPEVLLQVGTGAPLTGSKGRRRSKRV